MMNVPDPDPSKVRFPNVAVPLENVLDEAEASFINIVEVPAFRVRFVTVPVFHTVPVPVSVQVPDPMVRVRTLVLLDEKERVLTLNPLALKVPLVNVIARSV